jgi:acetyltransferase-like isoleucine patch superfamily enzyme
VDPSSLVRQYPNVQLGEGVVIDDFCIIGRPPRGKSPGASVVVIGKDSLIRSHTVVYAGVRIGCRFQSGHSVLIREDTTIGDDCSIGSGSVIEFAVSIGDGVRLHSQCFIPELSVLESHCWLGPRVVLTNAKFPAASQTKSNLQPVRIATHARVGANVTILPGVVLGAGCLVAAGSVVTADVPVDTLVMGNPARARGRVSELRNASGFVYRPDAEG